MKKEKSHVDLLMKVKDAEKYTKDFKGLPNLKNLETAQQTIKKLDRLHSKYKKARDKNGMLHCTLIAEIAENQASRKGQVNIMNLFSEWLKKARG